MIPVFPPFSSFLPSFCDVSPFLFPLRFDEFSGDLACVVHAESCAKLRLVCFVQLGGTVNDFASWHESLPSGTEVIAVNPWQAIGTVGNERSPDLVGFTAGLLAKVLSDGTPFVFYGHSIGGHFAFEVAMTFENQSPKLKPL